MSETEVEVARIALATHGTIHELITGSIDGEELELDGKAVIGAVVTNCTIKVSSGRWILRDSTIRDCRFMFAGEAANVRTLVKELD
jgi:hypothetical protein